MRWLWCSLAAVYNRNRHTSTVCVWLYRPRRVLHIDDCHTWLTPLPMVRTERIRMRPLKMTMALLLSTQNIFFLLLLFIFKLNNLNTIPGIAKNKFNPTNNNVLRKRIKKRSKNNQTIFFYFLLLFPLQTNWRSTTGSWAVAVNAAVHYWQQPL